MMPQRSLKEIAVEIEGDWGDKISPHAKGYVAAMKDLSSINDNYRLDSGQSIVAYFIANAKAWKGPVARRVKQELREMLARYAN